MLADPHLVRLLENELSQDRAYDDVTARLLGDAGARETCAEARARKEGVFCGEALAVALTEATGGAVRAEALIDDGARYAAGQSLFRLTGPAAGCLAVERTVLNLLSHLCGIATLTARYVAQVSGTTRILATRKTLPGLREWQLLAVRAGGGWVHRRSLADGILIKENHQALADRALLVQRARATRSPLHRIEIEVQSLAELDAVLPLAPEVIMLDNFDDAGWREALTRIAGRCEVEVSGNMTPERAKAASALGVQYISVGALTHSAPIADIGLDFLR